MIKKMICLSLFCLVLIPGVATSGQGRVQSRERREQKPRPRAASTRNVAELRQEADRAREAGKIDAAILLYQQAVAAEPVWIDGWWYLGTLHYEKDQYSQGAAAFQRAIALQPRIGAPWAMLGLCEFRMGEYDRSLASLRQAHKLGTGDNQELGRVMRYHEGQLLLLKGDFETAQNIFGVLSYDNVMTEDLFLAHGLASLRLARIPSQISPTARDRQLIRRVGFAEHLYAQKNFGDAQREFEQLVADYPGQPGVQYAYGRFMINQRNDETAIAAFHREIETSPSHALARLQIAYIKLRNREPQDGLRYAREAVNLNPRLSLGHYVLGRTLLETEQVTEAVAELEVARRLSPNEPRIHFVLARAYGRAGRKSEADQARETFARLNRLAEESAAQGNPRGEVINESLDRPPQ